MASASSSSPQTTSRRNKKKRRPNTAGNRGAANNAGRRDEYSSGQWIEIAGRTVRLLSDDNEGSRHQRFIIRIGADETLLIAHNIDLARRVPVSIGDRVTLKGMYEWNDLGGLVHWTHHDPMGSEPGGFIEHAGKRYE